LDARSRLADSAGLCGTWARLSLRRPWLLALCGLLLFLAGLPGSVRLYRDLHTDLRELLPEGAPAAVGLSELERRLDGLTTLSIVVRTPDFEAGKRFSDALVAKLRAQPAGLFSGVYGRIDEEKAFFEAHGALYADAGDLSALRDGLKKGLAEANRKENPLAIDLEEEDEGASASEKAKGTAGAAPAQKSPQLDSALRRLREAFSRLDHFKDGYLASEDGRTLVISVTPGTLTMSLAGNQAVMAAVEKAVAEVNPASFHPGLQLGYGGDVRQVIEAQEALVKDLLLSSILVLVFVGLALLVFYRSLRAVPLLVLPLFTGVSLTFAISRVLVGYLNPNTAFLGSIIIGNGINPGIILLARWLEERRRGLPLEESLVVALRGTWSATLAASSAAAASYGTLVFVQFRGFNQFGQMGVVGMLLCWLSTYAVMPCLIVLYERWRPVPVEGPQARPPVGIGSTFLATLITGQARFFVGLSVFIVAGGLVYINRFRHDPVQYDFTRLGSRAGLNGGAAHWDGYVDGVMQLYQTPTVILTDSRADAAAVGRAVEEAKAKGGAESTIARVETLEKLVPEEQPRKLELLRELFSLLGPKALSRLGPADRALVERILSRTKLVPVSEADLPARLTRFFHEKDGKSGLLVMVYPTLESDSRHGRAMVRHAVEVRQAAQAAVPGVRVAGQLLLTADIIRIITDDGLLSGLLSFAAVAVLALLAMRSLRHASWVVGSLCLGVLWMFGVLGLFAIQFNFVNFVVLPITFGIGVDYAVNLYQRYRETGSAKEALASSGGAVTLCSSTTIIGYAALLVADNQAIQSFGLTAVIGEFTCLTAALLALPALLAAKDGKGARSATVRTFGAPGEGA
jgi:uncharacterized protein